MNLPFAGTSGRSVRVAVIDSGVNQRHPHITPLAGGICISENGALEAGDFSDYLGHGTAVTAAIQEKAPDAEYFAVRLFQTSLRTNIDGLFNAIHWAIDQRVNVINLSLGTSNIAHASRFDTTIERALQQDISVVSAHGTDGKIYYPGCLPGVIRVGLDWDCPRERYRYEEAADGVVFYASGYPRSLPGMPRERNLNGVSFAVANMCGFVIRACEAVANRDPDFRSADATKRALMVEADTADANALP